MNNEHADLPVEVSVELASDIDWSKILSWGFAAEGLATGGLSFVGGQIFSAAFSNTPDITNVIAKAVNELKDFIKQQLDAVFVDECNRRVAALYNLLREYHNAPVHSEDRLIKISNETNDLMFLLHGKGGDASIINIMATSLHIIALYTRYLRYEDKGELKNIKNTIEMAGAKTSDWLNEINVLIKNIATDITWSLKWTRHRGWTEYTCTALFQFNGKSYSFAGHSSGGDYVPPGRGSHAPEPPKRDIGAEATEKALTPAKAARDRLINEFQVRARDLLLTPAHASLRDWDNINKLVSQKAI